MTYPESWASVPKLQETMLHSWDSVDTAEFRVLEKPMKPWRGVIDDEPQDFMKSKGEVPLYHSHGWYGGPGLWRFDTELPRPGDGPPFSNGIMLLTFVVNGDRWEIRADGETTSSGSRAEAIVEQEKWFVRGFFAGRPYLSAKENAQLHYWSTPQLWVTNYNLIILDWHGRPRDGEILGDHKIVRVLASRSHWVHEGPVAPDQRRHPENVEWYTGADWNGDQEIWDDADFIQLWVDSTSGFIRRIAKEETNGRTLDIAVPTIVINEEIPIDIFDLNTS
jgi:hypothetical protein